LPHVAGPPLEAHRQLVHCAHGSCFPGVCFRFSSSDGLACLAPGCLGGVFSPRVSQVLYFPSVDVPLLGFSILVANCSCFNLDVFHWCPGVGVTILTPPPADPHVLSHYCRRHVSPIWPPFHLIPPFSQSFPMTLQMFRIMSPTARRCHSSQVVFFGVVFFRQPAGLYGCFFSASSTSAVLCFFSLFSAPRGFLPPGFPPSPLPAIQLPHRSCSSVLR